MPRPRCRLGGATPPSRTAVVHELSQRDTDAFIFGERCADLPRRRTSRTYSLPPNSRRAAPPICPDLIYDRHTYLAIEVDDSSCPTQKPFQFLARNSSAPLANTCIPRTRSSSFVSSVQ